MATRRQTGGFAPSHPPRASRVVHPVYEEFSPISKWKQQELSQLLLVYLPGAFLSTRAQIPSEFVGSVWLAVINGVDSKKVFRIPEECNIKGIHAKFEGGTLTIAMPKKIGVLLQVFPNKEEAKTTKSEAHASPRDQLPPKTISTVSEAKRTDGKGITQEPISQKFATEPPNYQKDQAETPPKPASSTDAAKQAAEGKGTAGSTSAAKIIPETSETKERSQGKWNFIEVKKPESIVLGKTVEKEKEIGEKGKESLEAENPIEKTIKKEREGSEATASVHKGKTPNFSDVTKEKLTTDDVTSDGAGAADDHEGFTLHRYKQAIKGFISKGGNLKEERQLIVNMGMSILVIVAVGAYISYTLGSSSGQNEH